VLHEDCRQTLRLSHAAFVSAQPGFQTLSLGGTPLGSLEAGLEKVHKQVNHSPIIAWRIGSWGSPDPVTLEAILENDIQLPHMVAILCPGGRVQWGSDEYASEEEWAKAAYKAMWEHFNRLKNS
jgi:hypothetical protein